VVASPKFLYLGSNCEVESNHKAEWCHGAAEWRLYAYRSTLYSLPVTVKTQNRARICGGKGTEHPHYLSETQFSGGNLAELGWM
jgi:hypothetical protein